MSALTLSLFGSPTLTEDGVPVDLPSRKALALLAYLAVTGTRHRRNAVAALFWPESDRERSQNTMRYTLSLIRRALKERWLVADRYTVGLDDSHLDAVDVLRFRGLLAQCATHGHAGAETCPQCLPLLSETVNLYRDDFLAGFTLRDSVQFDTWQSLEAEGLRLDLVDALARLVEGLAQQGEAGRATGYARRWLALEPLDEAAHRALMRLYAGSGQQSAALRQYEACERVLMDELGVAPSTETEELFEAIKERRIGQLQIKQPASAEPPVRPHHNLPPRPTQFVGREEELDQIAQRLADPACRLLTIVGPGGMGKSRLAIQAGKEHLSLFRDGVWFVPLASLNSADLLPSAILEALGLPRYGGQYPQTQLQNSLRKRNLLLILDNFEHLLEGTAIVTEMLAEAPLLKLLVTSRQWLDLQEEWLLRLEGMAYPDESTPAESTLSILEDFSAVELFVQSARRVRPDFSLAQSGPSSVAHICRLVAGMPLAIELAAPWIRMMPCDEIAREIDQDIAFLATSRIDIPPRHRSMHAVFKRSWELLSAGERDVLRKLSVFRGGFRREAAEVVTGAALPVLSSLLDGSWIATTPSGRYVMHELARQYCEEHLQQDRETSEGVRDRHSEYYSAFLEEQEPHLKGRDQFVAFRSILEEMGNVRVAWDWAAERSNLQALDMCVDCLYEVGMRHGWHHEAMQCLDAAVTLLRRHLSSEPHPGEVSPDQTAFLLGRILCRRGHLTIHAEGISDRAVALFEESVALLEGLEPSPRQQKACAFVKALLGWFAHMRGDALRSGGLLEEARTQAALAGDEWTKAYVLFVLYRVPLASGRYVEAEVLLREAISLFAHLGDQYMGAWCLNALRYLLWRTGDYEEAERTAIDLLRVRRELGHPQGLDLAYLGLAEVEVSLGKYDEASQHYRDMLTIGNSFDDPYVSSHFAYGMGIIAAAKAQHAEAAERLGCAASSFRDLGVLATSLRALVKVGHAVRALGDTQRAAECFRQALRETLDAAYTTEALGSLVGLALLLTVEGEPQQAAEIASLALHHHAINHEDRVRAERLLTELESELSPEVLAAAMERGQARELEEVTAEILGAEEGQG